MSNTLCRCFFCLPWGLSVLGPVGSTFSPDSYILMQFGFCKARTLFQFFLFFLFFFLLLFQFFIQPDWIVSDLVKHLLCDLKSCLPSWLSSMLCHLFCPFTSKLLFVPKHPTSQHSEPPTRLCLQLGNTVFHVELQGVRL